MTTHGTPMTYEFECKHVFPDCAGKVQGETEEEVLEKAARHADEHHGVRQLDAEVVQKVRTSIRPA
jgi:predicted small metal-binding protein